MQNIYFQKSLIVNTFEHSNEKIFENQSTILTFYALKKSGNFVYKFKLYREGSELADIFRIVDNIESFAME